MTPNAFRTLALSFPGTHEEPHFERTSFRVGKRIFATMTADGREAMIPVKQAELRSSLLGSRPQTFFSHGGWTERNGSLGIRLAKATAGELRELLEDAWQRIAPRKVKTRLGKS